MGKSLKTFGIAFCKDKGTKYSWISIGVETQPPLVVVGAGVAGEAWHELLHQAGESVALAPSPPPSTSSPHSIRVDSKAIIGILKT